MTKFFNWKCPKTPIFETQSSFNLQIKIFSFSFFFYFIDPWHRAKIQKETNEQSLRHLKSDETTNKLTEDWPTKAISMDLIGGFKILYGHSLYFLTIQILKAVICLENESIQWTNRFLKWASHKTSHFLPVDAMASNSHKVTFAGHDVTKHW